MASETVGELNQDWNWQNNTQLLNGGQKRYARSHFIWFSYSYGTSLPRATSGVLAPSPVLLMCEHTR